MKKMNEQINGQFNIFDFTDDPRPKEFEHKEKPKPCDGCIFMDDRCFWADKESTCRNQMMFTDKKNGWHRIKHYPNGYVTGEWPENTEYRKKVEVIKLSRNRWYYTTGEGRNGAIIMPKDTPEGDIVAWRYIEDGLKSGPLIIDEGGFL